MKREEEESLAQDGRGYPYIPTTKQQNHSSEVALTEILRVGYRWHFKQCRTNIVTWNFAPVLKMFIRFRSPNEKEMTKERNSLSNCSILWVVEFEETF